MGVKSVNSEGSLLGLNFSALLLNSLLALNKPNTWFPHLQNRLTTVPIA